MSGPFVPKEEAQVGEPYEKVQLTLQHLAERIERTRQRILAYVRAKAQGGIDPLTKRTMQLGIWTELKIILTQCKAFATNRGVVGEFMNDRAKLRKSLLRRKPLTKRFGKYKSFDGAAIAFLSFAEGWLEREGLLLNVSPPPSSFVEETWAGIEKAEHEARQAKHGRALMRRRPPAVPDTPLKQGDQEGDAHGDPK